MTNKLMKDYFTVGLIFSIGAGLVDLVKLIIECM